MTLSLLTALQAAAPAAPHGAVRWVWLAIALPLAGFLVNGALALRRPQAKTAVFLREDQAGPALFDELLPDCIRIRLVLFNHLAHKGWRAFLSEEFTRRALKEFLSFVQFEFHFVS